MSNYRRLISYIYAYEGGVKGKNIGFAKIESRGNQCKISVNVKKVFVGGTDMGVYLLSGNEEIRLGSIFVRNGAGEFRAMVTHQNVENSGITMDQCYGLTVHDIESTWRAYTTIWEDAVAQAAEIELEDVTAEKCMAEEMNKGQINTIGEEKSEKVWSVSQEIEAELEMEGKTQEETQLGTQTENNTQSRAEIQTEVQLERRIEAQKGIQMQYQIENEPEPGYDIQVESDRSDYTIYIPAAQARPMGRQSERSDKTGVWARLLENNRQPQYVAMNVSGEKQAESQPVDFGTNTDRNGMNAMSENSDSYYRIENIPDYPDGDQTEPMQEAQVTENIQETKSMQDGQRLERQIQPVEMDTAQESKPEMTTEVPREIQQSIRQDGQQSAQQNIQQSIPPSSAADAIPEAGPNETPQNTPPAIPSEDIRPVIHQDEGAKPAFPNQKELDRLQQEEGDFQEEDSHEKFWEQFRKERARIPAFDYESSCEILTIKPQDIGLLPRECWVYGNNSFLLHGYYNYRYLILAKLGCDNPEGPTRYLLGIPGHYYSNEKYMATMFGFPNFVLSKKQPAENGRFGYWYADVKLGN